MVSYLPLYYKSVKSQEDNVNSFVIFHLEMRKNVQTGHKNFIKKFLGMY